MSVWEGSPFTIQATRVQETSIPLLSRPPGDPPRFDGRLRSVALSFKYTDSDTAENLIIGGKLGPSFIRGNHKAMLQVTLPKYIPLKQIAFGKKNMLKGDIPIVLEILGFIRVV